MRAVWSRDGWSPLETPAVCTYLYTCRYLYWSGRATRSSYAYACPDPMQLSEAYANRLALNLDYMHSRAAFGNMRRDIVSKRDNAVAELKLACVLKAYIRSLVTICVSKHAAPGRATGDMQLPVPTCRML